MDYYMRKLFPPSFYKWGILSLRDNILPCNSIIDAKWAKNGYLYTTHAQSLELNSFMLEIKKTLVLYEETRLLQQKRFQRNNETVDNLLNDLNSLKVNMT